MAQIRVFSSTLKGFIEYTGNTLGITTVTSSSAIAINALLQATPAPPSGTVTTLANWSNASASAFLTGLPGSTVVKAFLAWYGQPTPDVSGSSAAQNNAVLFTDPTGTTTSISPNVAWSQAVNFSGLIWITKVQDVTSIVTSAGTGMYTVGKIPSGGNFTGWTLAVVWSNNSLPPRFMTVDSYDDINNNAALSLTVGGFITPAAGTVTGRSAIVVSGAESNTNGGGVKFGPTVAGLVPLSGPRNPATNFFQCQINDANSESATVGQLDTTGTWGNNNTPLNSNPAVNARWHFDQTNVDITSGLTNNQRVGIFRFDAAPNPYIVNLISLQIDAQAPSFVPTKSVDKSTANVGDTLTYTIVFTNTGNNASNNAIIIDTLPAGVTFVTDSVELNGVPQTGATITAPSGFNAGSIAEGVTTTVIFKGTVNNVSAGTVLTNTYSLGYNYSPSNAPTLTFSNNIQSNIVNTTVLGSATISNTKTVNKAFANIGDTLQYTVVVKTFGNLSVSNIVFTDTIPTGTTLVANSFKVNGVTIVGGNPNPPVGVILGTLPSGTTQTITFNVTINTLPNPNPIPNASTTTGNFTQDPSLPNVGTSTNSNIVLTQVNNVSLGGITKLVDKSFATCGEVITYTIVIPNSGNVTALNVVFKDTLPNGTVLLANSVSVNGVQQTGANPGSGVTIPNIAPGATSTITFSVQVLC